MSKFEKILAEILLQLMHPLLIPIIGLMYSIETNSFNSLLPASYKLYMYIIMLIAIYLIPLSSMPLLKNIGTISDYRLSKPKDRIFLAIIVLIGIYFVYKTFGGFQIPIPQNLRVFILLMVIFDFVVIFGSIVYKFSLRTLFFSGTISFIIPSNFIIHSNNYILITTLLIMMGLAASLEIMLQRNVLKESIYSLLTGTIIGLSLSLLLIT